MSSTSGSAQSFVDTNVLVYAHDARAGEKRATARTLVAELWGARRGCVSIQVLQELFTTLTTKLPLDRATATAIVEETSAWRTHVPDTRDVLAAIDLSGRYMISFSDAMIVRSAVVLGCETVWTEDLNAGQWYDGVLVVNPFAA